MENKYTVAGVQKNSIAEEMEIEPGDLLLAINQKEIADIFDYRYLIQDSDIELLIEKPDGEQWLLEIEKEPEEDLGLIFESGLMDEAKSCRNKCIFCFIDQLPKGLRETLYFKDDDSRLSFLQGNYVTLTNMSDADLERIVYYHLSPINISVHTTDLSLRRFMLKNPNAEKLLAQIEKLKNAGITMNFQIVLVKGVNDGAHLDQTIADLSAYIPNARSLSVVPVGITKYRAENGLPEMPPFLKEDAQTVLAQVRGWQKKFQKKFGTSFVFAADEFYLKAEAPVPEASAYEDFPQIENGVGMIAMTRQSFFDRLAEIPPFSADKTISVATGKAGYALMRALANGLTEKAKGLKINVWCIENEFFGEHITVSGLLTGRDIIGQLTGQPLGDALLIPENALRAGETVLLDDVTVEDIAEKLGLPVMPLSADGAEWIDCIIRMNKSEEKA
ncbi:MAG: DUF512 domain-containing protein [Clostridiales bacterium]|jgi:putative radical SAM enzyme (TIGR03279 family)|nr:DUF512 domain-containing protein [Clostridiales bacterium]